MANRRMFSKSITNSSNFLMMPLSSQGLYFHLGMNADDDGFCEHFTIMRMVEAKPDDLKILQAKGFIQIFDEKVLIVIDWKENNYLRTDRYTPSKYLEIYKKELKMLSSGIPEVNQMATQDRLGKDRLGKDRKELAEQNSALVVQLIKEFETINPTCKTMYGNTTQRKACLDLIETYSYEKTLKVITDTLPLSNKQPFFPNITTPKQLFDKWSSLEIAVHKYQNERKEKQEKKGNVYF